ncbi:MAG: aldo/keto reductase [Demequinaceae bacterium]|nr:aldo/keto reductase [Demequinaceae bacterium]
MERRRAGTTGLEVSRLSLGTMTWSRDTDEVEAGLQLDAFLDAGGTLVDTAASYAAGGAESLLGSLMTGSISRRDIQISTKAGATGASIDALLATLDDSLSRLGTDHVDLFLVHAFDPVTPIEETLHALEIAVQSGRARYVGISNFPGWATSRAATLATKPALAVTEVEYSLAQRGIEREVLPAAKALGLGVLAWSPLGRGVLTGKYREGIPADSRAGSDHLAGFVEPYLGSRVGGILDALITAADGLGRTPHEVALAWVRDAPGVTSAIVGARTAEQLAPSLSAEDLSLPAAIRDALSEVSAPMAGYPERR